MSLELLLEVGKVSRTTFQGQGKRKGASDHLGPDHGSTGGHIFLMTFANMLIIVSLETNILKRRKSTSYVLTWMMSRARGHISKGGRKRCGEYSQCQGWLAHTFGGPICQFRLHAGQGGAMKCSGETKLAPVRRSYNHLGEKQAPVMVTVPLNTENMFLL